MWRCVILCLLAGPVLGGCGNYFLKQEVESKYGPPELVRYVSGEKAGVTLYGKSKPSGLGTIDREEWYYIYRQLLVTFPKDKDKYEVRPLSVWEILNAQQAHAALRREDGPHREGPGAQPALTDRPPDTEYRPGKLRPPPDYFGSP